MHQSTFWLKLAAVGCALVLFISIPFIIFGDATTAWAQRQISGEGSLSYVVIALVVLLILDIALPIPSSLLCVAAFALLPRSAAFMSVTVGLTLSYVAGHVLGARLGVPMLKRFFLPEEVRKIHNPPRSTRYLAIALSRPLPVLAEATAIYLGSIGTPLLPATLCAALASTGLAAMYGWVAHAAHAQESLWMALLASMVLPGLFWAGSRALRRVTGKHR